MGKKEKLQWKIIEKAKEKLNEWSEQNDVHIHKIHFVPMFDSSLEVYIFYDSDNDVNQNQVNGNSEKVKQVFLQVISEMGYMKHFSERITFIFDSHEGVMLNYQGSYFLRLR